MKIKQPQLPVLSFIVSCNYKLNETVSNPLAKTVRKTIVQEEGKQEQSSMT